MTCKLHNKLGRLSRWCGRNLILTVVIVGAAVALWPSNDHISPYRMVKSVSQNFHADYAMEEMAMDADMGMAAPMMAKMAVRGGMDIMPTVHAEFAPDIADKKIIKNASLNLEVEDTEIARNLIEEKIAELGGGITNMNSHEARPGVLAYNFTLRIPAEKLDTALAQLAGLGVKKYENYSTSDITAQYADTQNRLKNLETRRDRLRELMDRETDSLSDVLQIDRELSSVQQQIENYERQLSRHDVDVAYSMLNLSVQPEPEIGDFTTPEWTPERTWKQAVNDLIRDLHHLVDRAVRVVVYAPIWIPVILILWGAQRFIRRRNKKQ